MSVETTFHILYECDGCDLQIHHEGAIPPGGQMPQPYQEGWLITPSLTLCQSCTLRAKKILRPLHLGEVTLADVAFAKTK